MILHDDLAFNREPILAPEWYEEHIFSRYSDIFKPISNSGKRLIFCSDRKLDIFLEGLVELGVDGLMPETPATSLNRLIEIGKEVRSVIEIGRDGGVIIASHSIGPDIPIENYDWAIEVYRKWK